MRSTRKGMIIALTMLALLSAALVPAAPHGSLNTDARLGQSKVFLLAPINRTAPLLQLSKDRQSAFALFAIPSTPAPTDFADGLFDRLKSYSNLGIDPDQIEMARFAVHYPKEAAEVFEHAVSEDYPYFAIVGAVKAGRANISGFTYAKCLTPITAIDTVFNKAASTIDNNAAKAKTNTVMGQASTYAANYAKAQTNEAKQQAIQQLAQNVPYFGDIPTICTFAFNTNFKAERNLNLVAGEGAKQVRAAYDDFKSGNVVSGVGDLISLGVSKEIACDLVDEAASGGLIGNVPGLGKLAKGACAGFVGSVIDGVQGFVKSVGGKAGDLAEGAYCEVKSIFANGCSEAPPLPQPTGLSTATAWCQPFGGLASFISKTNQPDDYRVVCNDGSRCRAEPGKPPSCATAAEIALHQAAQIAKNNTDFQFKLPQWASQFQVRWIDQCQDDACRIGLEIIRVYTVTLLLQQHAADPSYPYAWAGLDQSRADKDAKTLITQSAQRSTALNTDTTAKAAVAWEQITNAVWSKLCADFACVQDVAQIAADMHKAAIARQAAEPDSSSLMVQGEIRKEYGPKFQKAVDNSKVRADPNASPQARLSAMGCKLYLGRPNEFQCLDAAYATCVGYAKKGQTKRCYLAGTYEKYPVK
jgi:hypothetical protein